jgi:hypothetical protein
LIPPLVAVILAIIPAIDAVILAIITPINTVVMTNRRPDAPAQNAGGDQARE